MIGVTFFGVFLTPVFFHVIRSLVRKPNPATAPDLGVDGGDDWSLKEECRFLDYVQVATSGLRKKVILPMSAIHKGRTR